MADGKSNWVTWMEGVFGRLPAVAASQVDEERLAREIAEERAAILEYEGGFSREEANRRAYASSRKDRVSGAVALHRNGNPTSKAQ